MEIIKNVDSFIDFYPYDKKYIKKNEYPKKYPCICYIEIVGGGMGSEQEVVRTVYIPDGMDEKSFIAGFKEGFGRGE